MAGKIFIGTSGWSYGSESIGFYPKGMKAAAYLSYYASQFPATEINTSFYQMPRSATIKGWVEKVPANFKFCPKISKYITHNKRLKGPEEPLARFFEVFGPMKHMMGPVLIQLPPSLQFDHSMAEDFFKQLKSVYKEYEFALEVRHESWLSTDSVALITKYNIALIISQSGAGFPYAELTTAPNIYVRFHGPGKLYASGYTDDMLLSYARKFKTWSNTGHNVWAFFNNGWLNAIADASRMKLIINK